MKSMLKPDKSVENSVRPQNKSQTAVINPAASPQKRSNIPSLQQEKQKKKMDFTFQQFTKEEQKRKLEILKLMDEAPKNIKYQEQHHFLSYFNHISYIYARISRALLYNYESFTMEEFRLKVDSYQNFGQTITSFTTKTFFIILQRLQIIKKITENLPKDLVTQIDKNIESIERYLKERQIIEVLDQTEFIKQQQYHEEEKQELLKVDLYYIELIVDLLIINQAQNLSLKIVEECQKANIQTIDPFIGPCGKQDNLIISYEKKYNKLYQPTQIINDFRGVIGYGTSDTIYICWHGSCQEYDWHANLDVQLVSPRDDLLNELPRNWKMHQGYSEIIQQTWDAKQQINTNNQNTTNTPTFIELIRSKLQNKKCAFFTGHSQGAGLGVISCVYAWWTMRKAPFNDLDIRGWFFSLPRVFDQDTSSIINKIFNIDQKNPDNKLIRQNVLGDPVPLSFSSCQEVFQRIRRLCSVFQIIFQDQFFGALKTVCTDKGFLDSLRKVQQSSKYDIQGYIQGQFIQNEILKPLYSPQYNGNFAKFLIDYSAADVDLFHKQLWDVVAKQYKEKIAKILSKDIKEKLGFDESMINGGFLRAVVNSIGRLISVDVDSEDNLEDLIFQSEYYYMHKIYQNKKKLAKQEKEKQEKEKQKFTIGGIVNNIKEKFDKPSDLELGKQSSADLFKEESPELIFSKALIKAMLLEKLEEKLFTKQLSCVGSIFEGVIFHSGNYGDIGMFLLDQLDFHKTSRRVEDLYILENFFGSQTQNVDVSTIDYDLALHKSKTQILSYFSPYHYGQQDLDGSFDPELVIDSQLIRMHAFATFHENLDNEAQYQELYRLGILKQHKDQIHSMSRNEDNFIIMLRRIEAQIQYIPIVLEEECIMEQNQKNIVQQGILEIIKKFDNVKNIKEVTQKDQQNKQLFQLVSFSYFLSSIIKSLQVVYTEQNNVIELQCKELYKNFIFDIIDRKDKYIDDLLLIQQQFVAKVFDYIRLNQYSAQL